VEFILKFYNFLEPKWLDDLKKFEQVHKIWSYSSGFAPKKPGPNLIQEFLTKKSKSINKRQFIYQNNWTELSIGKLIKIKLFKFDITFIVFYFTFKCCGKKSFF